MGPHIEQCYSQLLHTSSSIPDDPVIVVGSGPPAAAATVLMTKAGVNVTLLEAGLPERANGLTVRLRGLTVARMHRPLETRKSDVTMTGDPASVLYEDVAPGGLTNHWSCAVPRFSQDDFIDARRGGEAHAWPLDYQDLAPWYDWVEPYLRIAGTTIDYPQLPAGKVATATKLGSAWAEIAAAAQREGQALLPVPYVYGAETTLTRSGTVFNAYVRLIKPALRSGCLTVRHGSQVTQLEWSGARKRVEAVLVRDVQSGATHRLPCRAVVVAAGAINSAKILLQSTSPDFPQGLGNTHGVLGRYLHDHPIGKVEIAVARPMPFQPATCFTRQALDKTVPLYAAACLQWSGVGMLARSLTMGHPGRLATCGFNIFGTMAPALENFVALDTSRRASDGTPALVLNMHHPPEAMTTLEAARDNLTTLLDHAQLRPQIRMWDTEPVGGAVHFAGTCRMHASPQFGMLDKWSRLHAVPNVVVADSSAFTTGPEKNPVLTAMALAARASQRLVDDMRAGTI
jgi:choline dehydrogenase-like flavoprotein